MTAAANQNARLVAKAVSLRPARPTLWYRLIEDGWDPTDPTETPPLWGLEWVRDPNPNTRTNTSNVTITFDTWTSKYESVY